MADRRENPQPLLLIDDDPSFSGFIAKGLERAGLPIIVASTGQSGLEALQTGRYPLVLLDLVLPDIDGLEVLRRVKTWRPAPSVILLSGLGSIRTAVEAIRLGALDFLEKPLDVQDLVDTVRSHLPIAQADCDSEDSALLDFLEKPINVLDPEDTVSSSRRPQQTESPAEGPIADLVRWTVAIAVASKDTRTLEQWARLVGASTQTIFQRCSRSGVRAKPLLDLGRILRISRLCSTGLESPFDHLSSLDARTVDALLGRAGLTSQALERFDAVRLLSCQELVRHPELIQRLQNGIRQQSSAFNDGLGTEL